MDSSSSQQIQLIIALDPQTNKVSVSGPIDNKQLAYALLEIARDAIYDYNKQQENRVQPPPAGFLLG